jgi:hypothetical protein
MLYIRRFTVLFQNHSKLETPHRLFYTGFDCRIHLNR